MYGDRHPALSATIPHIEPKPRRVLSEQQALTLLASFNTYTAEGARGLALIAFGLDTGFRKAELCSMQLANVDFYSNTAAALCKGNQWGYGAFSEQTAAILQHWLAFRKPADGTGNLFISLKGGKALTPNGLGCMFKRLTKTLGFPISCHDLRSSHATLAKVYGASDYAGMLGGRWKTTKQYHHYIGSLQLNVIRPHLPVANLLNPGQNGTTKA
jgi:integrase